MFSRIVSPILIAAIIACPLSCGNGLCHAGPSCSAEQSTDDVCPLHGTAECCCTEADDDDRSPCRCPDKSRCQGVCGGAIFEKQVEVDDVADSFFLPLVDIDIRPAARLVEFGLVDRAEHHWHSDGGNFGRSLCTLHMSFLC